MDDSKKMKNEIEMIMSNLIDDDPEQIKKNLSRVDGYINDIYETMSISVENNIYTMLVEHLLKNNYHNRNYAKFLAEKVLIQRNSPKFMIRLLEFFLKSDLELLKLLCDQIEADSTMQMNFKNKLCYYYSYYYTFSSEHKDLDLAVMWARRGLLLDDENHKIYLLLKEIYFKQGDFLNAKTILRKGKEAISFFAKDLYMLEYVYLCFYTRDYGEILTYTNDGAAFFQIEDVNNREIVKKASRAYTVYLKSKFLLLEHNNDKLLEFLNLLHGRVNAQNRIEDSSMLSKKLKNTAMYELGGMYEHLVYKKRNLSGLDLRTKLNENIKQCKESTLDTNSKINALIRILNIKIYFSSEINLEEIVAHLREIDLLKEKLDHYDNLIDCDLIDLYECVKNISYYKRIIADYLHYYKFTFKKKEELSIKRSQLKEYAHYTSLTSLKEMLAENTKMHLTNVISANDPKEGKIFTEAIREQVVELGLDNNSIVPCYSFCLAQGSDSLNLFRFYGDDLRGASINFKTQVFDYFNESISQSLSSYRLYLFRVIYEGSEEFKELVAIINELLNETNKLLRSLPESEMINALYSPFIMEKINFFQYLVKGSYWQDEKEIRVVLTQHNVHSKNLKVEEDGFKLYLETDHMLEIDQVTLGPSLENADQVKSYLHYKGLRNITTSSHKYRI